VKLYKAITVGLTAFLALHGAAFAEEATSGSTGRLSLGYRAFSIDADPGRAAEYVYPHSSPAAEVEVTGYQGHHHAIVEADYRNEEDFRAEAHLDHSGLLRLNLRTERFFHNLEHIPYAPGVPEARAPASVPGSPRADFADSDPGADYGLSIDITEAQLRGKLANYPAHVNLSYWRFEKEGEKQLRYVRENCAGACHMQSRTRDLDRVVEEFKGGVDGHFGPVDVIFEQVYREFRDHESIPVDAFERHSRRDHLTGTLTGDYQHDEDPDSKYVASTLKAHTSLSGGVVGAASFTIGERENRTDLSDVRFAESETNFYKATGDLTLIPSPRWTLNFRYRLLDMDNDNSNQLVVPDYYPDPADNTVKTIPEIRENIDTRRANYAATVTYRPFKKLSLKGEYQREEIHRGNTDGAVEFHSNADYALTDYDLVWELPQDEVLSRYRIGFMARLLERSRLKLNGWYQYRTSDDPAYGNSAEDAHQVFLGALLTPSSRWGMNASVSALDESNNDHQLVQFNNGGGQVPVDLDRRREQQSLAVGLWFNPAAGVSAALNYGYLRTRILQDLLFGSQPDPDLATGYSIKDENVEYAQRVQTLSANLSWQLLESLRASIEGHHIRSFGDYDPDFSRSGLVNPADSDGLKTLSEVDIRQNGLNLGLAWSPTPVWTCSANFTYDDYEERNSSAFDGTVETYMVSLARSW